MGEVPRIQRADEIYFVTNRCSGERFRFGKAALIKPIFEGLLAKYQERYEIDIFGHVCMGNHFHLIVRAPKRNMHLFMKDFQSDLATEVNRMQDQSGQVFGRRYSAIPILDTEMRRKMLAYLYNNPVKARLCKSAGRYKGATSYDLHMQGKESKAVKVLNRTRLYELKRRRDFTPDMVEQAYDHFQLKLTPLPAYEGLSVEERSRRICTYVEGVAKSPVPEADFDRVKDVSHKDRPKNPKRSVAPKCLTICAILRARYLVARQRVVEDYKESSYMQRKSKFTPYPVGTIPHGWLKAYTEADYIQWCSENALESQASSEEEVPRA